MNRRLNNVFRHHGKATIQFATEALVAAGTRREQPIPLAKEFHRLLVEAAAIVDELLKGDALVINAKKPDVVISFHAANNPAPEDSTDG